MNQKLSTLSLSYHPLTSTPFLKNNDYCELPPSDALKPYIRCFWGNEHPQIQSKTSGRLIIPDTCMDIIIKVNHSNHTVDAGFCTMDEHPYQSRETTDAAASSSIFGIRFFFWTAMLFSPESFRHTKNQAYHPDEFFQGITAELTEIALRFNTLTERARAAEEVFLRRINSDRLNCDFMNAVNDMIMHHGRRKISEIARGNAMSERKMERIFADSVGISPKTLSNLIRYQLVWQELARGGTDILNMVEKYGYTDQPHLLNDFRSRHGMTPTHALKIAHVGFLQDKPQSVL